MSGNSSVGNAAVYEAGDQRNPSASEKEEIQPERYEEGKENSHKENDSSESSVRRCLPSLATLSIPPPPRFHVLTAIRRG